MHRLPSLIGLTLGCSACTERTHMLSELPNVQIRLQVTRPIEEQPGSDDPAHIIVDVEYSAEKFGQLHDVGCAVLEDISGPYATLDDEHATSATFDDAYMEMTDNGGVDDTGTCRPPRFEIDWQVGYGGAAEVELAVGDSRESVRADFYRSLLDPRRATLLSHDSWTFAGGDAVTLEWSHLADTGAEFAVWLEGPDPVLLAKVHPVDGTLTFAIPSPPPVTGDRLVHIAGGSYPLSGGAARCDGAERCRWMVPQGYRHQVVIE